jgi:hypothetical protein
MTLAMKPIPASAAEMRTAEKRLSRFSMPALSTRSGSGRM